MARYTGPACKVCRRENMKLFLKGSRCYTDKCGFDRRPYAPGQHGQRRRTKDSEYGIRLREKQKVRSIYGLLERQFRSYFEKADRTKGVTGEALLGFLERRLDNVCFRLGLASTRAEARQLVRHKHILINDRILNIPSYLVKPGDKISVRESSRNQGRIASSIELSAQRGVPTWLEFDKEKLSGVVKSAPIREEITLPIEEQMIVEFYSR